MLFKEIQKLKRQWFKKNLIIMIFLCILLLVFFIVGAIFENYILIGSNTILCFVIYCVARNKMIIFVEKNTDKRDAEI